MPIPQMGLPDFLGSFNEQRQIGERRGLAQLYGQAMQGPREDRPSMLAKMAGTDPQTAMAAQKHFDANDEVSREKLGQYAAAFDALPDEQKPMAYPQLAKQAQELGIPAPAEWNPAFAPNIQKLAMTLSGGKGPEDFTLSPGSKRFDASGRMLAEVPFAPANASLVSVPDGQGGMVQMEYDPRTRQFALPQYPGKASPQPAQAAPQGADVMGDAFRGAMGPQGVQSLVQSLAGQFGGQVSSLQRSPQHNAKVGGVANSQHITGTAGDVVVPQPQRAAFIAAARAKGLEAIDEGDHIHLELPPGRQTAQAGRMGYTPPKAGGDSALQDRIKTAREMGATDDDIRRMVIGREGAAAGAKPMPAAALRMVTDANSALKEVETVNSTLARVRAEIASDKLSLGPLRNVVNRGRVMAGMGNDESTRLSTMERSLRGLQNAALRLNKGVQTEGDAQRIWQELLGNLNDEQAVLANIDRLVELNNRARDLHEMNLETVNDNYGRQAKPAQQQDAPPSNDIDSILDKYR